MKKGLNISIPGWGQLDIKYLILDLNGTLALDGKLLPGVKKRLKHLSTIFERIFILTADTYGTVAQVFQNLPVQIHRIASLNGAVEKQMFVKNLNSKYCVTIGNGVNDSLMFKEAALSICILGEEGTAVEALLNAHIIVNNINDALDLFLFPKRLVATLRR